MNNIVIISKQRTLAKAKNLACIWVVVFFILPLVLTNCKKTDPVPENIPPSANLEFFSPISGDEPSMAVHLKLSGAAGTYPISRYVLYIDGKTSTSRNPIDTTINFLPGTYSIYGDVIDNQNLYTRTPTTLVSNSFKLGVAELTGSNTSSSNDSPIMYNLKLTGTPGSSPFRKFKLFITRMDPDFPDYWLEDKISTSSNPIDTLIKLYSGNYTIHGEIVDANNTVIKTSDIEFKVYNYNSWRVSFFPLPRGPVNLFETPASTPEEIAYNALSNQDARNAILPGKVESDITYIITGTGWTCSEVVKLFVYNAINLAKNIYSEGKLVYDGYDGDDIAQILIHGGTTKYFGTLGIPAEDLQIPVEDNSGGHAMSVVVTGDNLMDPNSYNFIELTPPYHLTNVKAGQAMFPLNSVVPMILYKKYTYEYNGVVNVANLPVVSIMNVDGKTQILEINPNVPIPLTREEARNYRK